MPQVDNHLALEVATVVVGRNYLTPDLTPSLTPSLTPAHHPQARRAAVRTERKSLYKKQDLTLIPDLCFAITSHDRRVSCLSLYGTTTLAHQLQTLQWGKERFASPFLLLVRLL